MARPHWDVLERTRGPAPGEEVLSFRVWSPDDRDGDELVEGHYHRPAASTGQGGIPAGVVWLPGIGGSLDGPGGDLYSGLARTLAASGITSMRLGPRRPAEIARSVEDTIVGIEFMRQEGIGPLAIVGHSSGGAVAITAGALIREVATVVTLATQSHGTDLVSALDPTSLLLVHGLDDRVLPPACSADVRARATTRTRLRLIAGAGHDFDGHTDVIAKGVVEWIIKELASGYEPRGAADRR